MPTRGDKMTCTNCNHVAFYGVGGGSELAVDLDVPALPSVLLHSNRTDRQPQSPVRILFEADGVVVGLERLQGVLGCRDRSPFPVRGVN